MKNFMSLCRTAISRFIRQSRGAVAIEAAFVLIVFVTIVAMIVDLGTTFVQQSRLERATYTGASVFRERIALYGDPINNDKTITHNAPVTQSEVNQLRDIVNQLMSRDDLVVMVDELQFRSATQPNPTTPIVLSKKRLTSYGTGNATCQSTLPDIEQYSALSPWSARQRWLPLYRVTVCIPGQKSWFKSIVSSSGSEAGLTVEELIAFNIVIPR